MENLEELAVKEAEKLVIEFDSYDTTFQLTKRAFIKGFQIANEDKKELLEALWDLRSVVCARPPFSPTETKERESAIFKANEVIKKHETI